MALQPVAHTTLMCPESSTLRYDDSPSDQLSRLKLVFMQHTAQCMPLKEAAQVGVDIVTRCHCYSGQRLDSASSTIKSNRKTTHLLFSAARCSTCSWRSCALLRSWSTLDTASCLLLVAGPICGPHIFAVQPARSRAPSVLPGYGGLSNRFM